MSAPRRIDQRRQIDLADMVDELTRSHPHRERYNRDDRGRRNRTRSRYHVTKMPSLLDQLEHARPLTGMDTRSGGYESRPTANLEALDAYHRIHTESARLLHQRHQPTGGTTTDRVRRLHPIALTDPDAATAIRRWWAQARVLTGWDTRPWRPDNTCPMCGELRSLRIRWHDEVALCVHCDETWDPTNIGLLAEHIRLEADLTRATPRPTPPACYCPLPQPQLTTLRLCPACGSARCIRALTTPPRDTHPQDPS